MNKNNSVPNLKRVVYARGHTEFNKMGYVIIMLNWSNFWIYTK